MKQILIFAVVMAIVSQIVNTVEVFLTMGYYLDPAYFPIWSKIMIPGQGAPPPEFFIYSIVFAFISWAIFGYVYSKFANSIKESNEMSKGLKFGFFVFLLAGIPFILYLYLLINIPSGLLVSWTISSLVLYLIGGIGAVKLKLGCA